MQRVRSSVAAFGAALAVVVALAFAFGLGAGLICGPLGAIGWALVLVLLLPILKPGLLVAALVTTVALATGVPSLVRQFGGRRFAVGVGGAALLLLLAGWGYSAAVYNAANNCRFSGA